MTSSDATSRALAEGLAESGGAEVADEVVGDRAGDHPAAVGMGQHPHRRGRHVGGVQSGQIALAVVTIASYLGTDPRAIARSGAGAP